MTFRVAEVLPQGRWPERSTRCGPLTIGQLIAQKIAKLGENISVRRFARFKIGESNYTIASAKVQGAEEATA